MSNPGFKGFRGEKSCDTACVDAEAPSDRSLCYWWNCYPHSKACTINHIYRAESLFPSNCNEWFETWETLISPLPLT